ncbi:MAG: hypothetical protein HGGPFJEG_00743 [Ignavibacteria bacterium]|nr:hypothetical protein [Ignavibacteria bacterium]
MEKSNLKYLVMLCACIIIFCTGEAMSQIKIGYVDSEIILKQLPEAQQVQKELEGLQKLYLDTIQSKENEIKAKAETFKSKYDEAQKKVETGEVKSESELKVLQDEIGALQQELQNLDEGLTLYKQNTQNSLLLRQQELFKPVKDKITKTIEEIAKSLKINFVFDKADGTLLFGDKEYDITFKVLDKLK